MLLAMINPATKKKVIFFGDSITQAGVEKGGYINVIGDLLQKKGKADAYELIGAGIGGNKVYDLYLRLEDDVLNKKPDIVFIYIGVNDVWHKSLLHTGTDLDKFSRFYTALIKKIKGAGAKVVLVTKTSISIAMPFASWRQRTVCRWWICASSLPATMPRTMQPTKNKVY